MLDDIRIHTLKINFVVFFFLDFLFSTSSSAVLYLYVNPDDHLRSYFGLAKLP